jgi:hypothetical protein
MILSCLKKGVSKLSIAKIIECSPSTLYAWIDRNTLEIYVRRKERAPPSAMNGSRRQVKAC